MPARTTRPAYCGREYAPSRGTLRLGSGSRKPRGLFGINGVSYLADFKPLRRSVPLQYAPTDSELVQRKVYYRLFEHKQLP